MYYKITGWVGIALSAVGFLGFFLVIAEQGYADIYDLGGVLMFALLLSSSIGVIKGQG